MTSIQNIQSGQIAYLYSQLGTPQPTSSNLADVLLNGFHAGARSIDMDNNDILQVSNINLATINGGAYPPVVAADTLQQVLDAGNTATDKDIVLVNTFGPLTTTLNSGSLITDGGFNLETYDPLLITTTNAGITATARQDITLESTTKNINLNTPLGTVYINGVPYPPAVDNLSVVLAAGNTATNSITLNNAGTGLNKISLLPNASASNPQITLTDGTTANTIDKNGYTTRNTTTNATNFLNFSDSSATGTGSIQKTSGIECNPFTKTVTATTFAGDLSGTATNATNVGLTSDNTAGTYYLPFAKTIGTGNKPLFIDDTTTPLTYNPSTSILTATNFSGTATNATNVGLTSDNTVGTYLIPFVKTVGTGNKPLFIDDVTGPLSYNPSTGAVSATTYKISGTPSTSTDASTFGQVGLVKIATVQVAITGSAVAQNLLFTSLFNSTYKNYRIILRPTTQVSFFAYPSYALQGFLGTGTLPTTASLFGNETTTINSGATVLPVFTSNATISSAPLVFAVSSFTNKEVQFEILNVGYTVTQTQIVQLSCNSVYSNPGITGASYRTIHASVSSSGSPTITGLSIQQTAISIGNNFTLEAIVYGYNQL